MTPDFSRIQNNMCILTMTQMSRYMHKCGADMIYICILPQKAFVSSHIVTDIHGKMAALIQNPPQRQ